MIPNEEIFDRLESYVDGALDAKARADVDRQLAANPQLRKLVDELLFGRDALRGLPRAKAPPELAETFQSSLERGALLGHDMADRPDVVLRINRWPQYASVAAIVLLTVGLAAIVYKMVPQKRGGLYANAPQPTGTAVGDGATASSSPFHEKLPDVREGSRFAATAPERERSDLAAGKPASDDAAKADADAVAGMKRGAEVRGVVPPVNEPGRAVVSADEVRDQQRRVAAVGKVGESFGAKFGGGGAGGAGGGGGMGGGTGLASVQTKDGAIQPQAQPVAGDEPLVLLVQSLDPRQANRDVARYFADNHIEYQTVTEAHNPDGPIPANAALSLAPMGGATASPSVAGKTDAASGGGSARGGVDRSQNGYGQAQNRGYPGNPAQQDAVQPPPQAQPMNRAGGYGNYASNNGNNNERTATPVPPPATPVPTDGVNALQQQQQQMTQAAGRVAANTVANPANELPSTTAPADVNAAANVALNNGVLLGNGTAPIRANTYRAMMSRRQVQQLNEQLARRDNQWAEVRTEQAIPRGTDEPRQQQLATRDLSQEKASDTGLVAGEATDLRKSAAAGLAMDRESLTDRPNASTEADKAKGGRQAVPTAPGSSDNAARDPIAAAKGLAPSTRPAASQPGDALAAAPAAAPPATTEPGPLVASALDRMRSAGKAAANEGVADETPHPMPSAPARQEEPESRMALRELQRNKQQDPATASATAAATTQPQQPGSTTTRAIGEFAKMAPDLQLNGAIKAEDALLAVLIVVNDEPVVYNFPAAPNAGAAPAPSTQPDAPAAPATAPAKPTENKPTEK